MDQSKKSNKIRDIVRLQQILKKWKKMANASKNNTNITNTSSSTTTSSTTTTTTTSKSMKFLKRTLSFNDVSNDTAAVPKGFLAVCVGKKETMMKRFIIPTEYLRHQAFGILLREAEEEFGFQQEGVLKIPCEVPVFEKILKVVEEKKEVNFFLHELGSFAADKDIISCCSPPSDCDLTTPHHPQMCR
ncbi:hypothetical protein TIFTF001_031680 [Ficus carica]|uniref:Uncharacterized protein n=1 Tax=Ficus carica TaxID=3494 RepID=A0AA88J5G8_FICCA|nr:hypothetical protein TIFTF001_031680 [Ficus carica]